MKVIKPPTPFVDSIAKEQTALFLGGSIEMGTAEKWQARIAIDLADYKGIILDPLREDWDPTWAQDPTPGTPFHGQVTWELDAQDAATHIIYYFDPNTKSPITLLELGLYASSKKVLVCCNQAFWRYGNVKITCDKYNITCLHSYDELLENLKQTMEWRSCLLS
jgi:hypothetical protein